MEKNNLKKGKIDFIDLMENLAFKSILKSYRSVHRQQHVTMLGLGRNRVQRKSKIFLSLAKTSLLSRALLEA